MVASLFGEGCVVRVLVPLALPSLLDYTCVDKLAVGDWVEIPVGTKRVHGLVAEVLTSSPFKNLKPCMALKEVPAVDGRTLEFYRWAARYTLSAPGEGLRVALPRALTPLPPKEKAPPKVLKTKKGKATTALEMQSPLPPAKVGVRVALNPGQQAAAEATVNALGSFQPFLLDGVTGSGKTEVYFHVIDEVLARGGQALVLVPEIALTPQWLKRFEERFGAKPLVWHSGLAEGARRTTWWTLARGKPAVVVGARSALFLPFQNLSLLVVDEEHEPSYKQEEAFRYHARDLAVQLARMWQAPILMASATPSLESWQRVRDGKYKRLPLSGRHGGTMAPIQLVDLRTEKMPKQTYVSPTLAKAVEATLAKGEQALMFLNRRGNAPVMICHACGTRRDCSRCDATLVVHGDRLQCHHCGFAEPFPDECAACGDKDLRAYGPGTRRVVGEVQALFPNARVAVADSDAVSTAGQLAALVESVENREVDIIVGTQMVTKGHHFPHLTCVGVIDADMGLAHGDVRAAERTFQLLTQVAGRAGRGSAAGKVFVQSHDPSQPLFKALVNHDRDGFYALELGARQTWGDPPFGRMIAVIVDGLEEEAVAEGAKALAAGYPNDAPARLLGPAPAPVAKIRDRYRYRLLVKGPAGQLLQGLVKAWIEGVAVPRGVRVTVDVDPVSFM
ncbi:MAG: primosomal protein N' [Pseudomonas fluorescens]|nr:MAG: primosomal protein N' [Pseudomonas fluorescens]